MWLSADIVAAHTGRQLLPARWLGREAGQPPNRHGGWLLLEIPATVFFVGMIQLLMESLLTDVGQPGLTRLIAFAELLFTVAWSIYLLAVLVIPRRGAAAD